MARTVSLDLLKNIQFASPCTADWEQMTGDDRTRFCDQCRLNVYNLASLAADDAADLIRSGQGHVCVRLYRRADGTVLTQDCPVGLRLLRMKAVRAMGRIAAAAVLLLTGGLAVATGTRDSRLPRLRFLKPFPAIRQWLSPTAPPMVGKVAPQFLMGRTCSPRLSPPAQSATK